jgi:molybdopterin converting factor subunit 1
MRILLFAQLKGAVGRAELELALDRAVDGVELWDLLLPRHPELAPFRAVTRLARNGSFAADHERFVDGDEVALIPPVSGG